MQFEKKFLIVDDEIENRNFLTEILEAWGHKVVEAQNGLEAITMINVTFDLVLLDVNMPMMDGYEVVRRIRGEASISDMPIIMVTSLSDRNARLRAVEVGANDFITKPIDINELRLRTESQLKMKAAQDEIKRHREELEIIVDQKTQALRRALQEMTLANQRAEQATIDTINRLALAAEYRDTITGTHIHRISHYCKILAEGLDLPQDEVDIIYTTSPMHDVGKLGIPDSILRKPAILSRSERDIMKQHTTIGTIILGESTSELLQAGEIIARSHHEKWDGSGYPGGLEKEEIPLWGRICSVADVFDAVTNERPYKLAFSNEIAYGIIKEGKGTHFDPDIVDIFFDRIDDISKIQNDFKN